MRIAILIGSMSDEEKMRPCSKVLDSLGIEHIFTVTSAHRTLERTERVIRECEARGCQIFICAAGLAAHLAGAVSARTLKPVIGVPLSAAGSALGGLDAMLATIYNGSAACAGCGGVMNPVTAMYAGGVCPDCTTTRSAKRVRQMMGR